MATGSIVPHGQRQPGYENGSCGIFAYGPSQVLGNTVYSNGVGIVADGIDFDWRSPTYGEDVENNLVYANTAEGVVVTEGIGTQLVNNTVYQIVGDAVQVNGSSQNITILNNILWTQAGYDLNVASDSQQGFSSNYNDLYATGLGAVGSWQGISCAALSSWQDATLQDLDSISADPLFVTPVQTGVPVGYINSVQDGRQDDFHEQSEYGTFTGGSFTRWSAPTVFPPI